MPKGKMLKYEMESHLYKLKMNYMIGQECVNQKV